MKKATIKPSKSHKKKTSGSVVSSKAIVKSNSVIGIKKKPQLVNKSLLTSQSLQSNARYEVFERISDAYIALDENWCYTYMNQRAGKIFGYNPKRMIGKNIWEEFTAGTGITFYKAYCKAFKTQRNVRFEGYHPAEDCWLEHHIYPSPSGLTVYFRDITEKKKAEEKIEKLNRLYLFISHFNQAIVRATDELTIFKQACEIAVEFGKFRMAWIGLIDEQSNKINPVVHAGEEKGYLSNIQGISIEDVPEGRGPTGRAIREGKYVICDEIANDPSMIFWKDAAALRGYSSSIAFPIRKYGKVIGAFSLYSESKFFFDSEETELLEQTAGDLSFALEIIEKDDLQKKTEEAVEKMEQRYQALAKVSPVGIFHTDTNGYNTYVSNRWCQISGLSRVEALGNGWLKAVHEDDKNDLAKGWQETTKKKGFSLKEFRFVRSDGTVAWVTGQAVPAWNAENNVVGYIGTITDITNQKKVAEEIIKEKELSDTILNNLQGICYLYDEKGKFIRWNKYFEKVTGYKSNEIHKRKLTDFYNKGLKETILKRIQKVLENDLPGIELELHTKSGKRIPYYINSLAIVYNGKNCILGMGIDISDRKKAEAEIRNTTEQLRQLTAHLQNIREEERKRIGREIHDELGQQLTAIKMDVAWINKKTPAETTAIKSKLKNILGLLEGSNQAVKRILGELRPEIFNNHGLLEAMEWQGRQFTASTSVPIEFKIPENDLLIREPVATCIFRVYQEALTNIMRYAKAKKVLISLTRDFEKIKLTVQDDGKGFDINVENSKKSFGILGMKERLLSLNGEFELLTAPGKGTKIIISIPLANIITN